MLALNRTFKLTALRTATFCFATLSLAACSDDGDSTTSTGTDESSTGDGDGDLTGDGDGDPSGDGDGDPSGDGDGDPGGDGDGDGDPTGDGDGLGETCDVEVHEVPAAASPNGPKLEATLTLDGTATVADLSVAVEVLEVMKASFLEIRLRHGEVTVLLFDKQCPENKNIDVSFSDQAGAIGCCTDWVQCEGDPVTGEAAPVQPLSAFVGAPVAGDWTLEILVPMSFDPFAPYQALLESWCLDIQG